MQSSLEHEVASDVAQALVRIGAVGVSLAKPITFKSGIVSPVYVDNRCLPFHPAEWRRVIDGFRTVIEIRHLRFDAIAGVAVGGVPHSSALAYALAKPSVFIRKEAKEHGRQKRVEGGDVTGLEVLLVEDLVTSGGSSLSAIEALVSEGGLLRYLLAIVSYGFPEAEQAFAEADVEFSSLTHFEAILAAGADMGRFSPDETAAVKDWLADPRGWAQRRGLA